MVSSIIAAGSGITLAWVFYILSPGIPAALAKNFSPVYNLLLNKYWIDEIYDRCIIRPFLRLTKFAFSFDRYLIDGAVNFTGTSCLAVSRVKGWIDKYIVDGLVNLIALVVGGIG